MISMLFCDFMERSLDAVLTFTVAVSSEWQFGKCETVATYLWLLVVFRN